MTAASDRAVLRPEARPDLRGGGYVACVHTDADSLETTVPAWRALASALSAPPVLDPTFALTWWERLGRGHPLVVTVHHDGQLVAVLPLHGRPAGPWTVLRWMSHGLGTVGSVLAANADAKAVRAAWRAVPAGRTVLQLPGFVAGGPGLLELRRSPRRATHLEVGGLCPVVDLSGGEHAHSRRRSLRRLLARADRAVASARHRHTVEVVRDPDHVQAVLPEAEAVCMAAEARNPRLDLFRPPYRGFTLALLDRAARTGALALFVGRLDGAAVSFDIAFRSGTTLYDWFGRISPAAAPLSPGHLLLRAVTEWAAAADLDRVDLMLGDDEYKRRWATSTYDVYDVVSAPPRRLTASRLFLSGLEARAALR